MVFQTGSMGHSIDELSRSSGVSLSESDDVEFESVGKPNKNKGISSKANQLKKTAKNDTAKGPHFSRSGTGPIKRLTARAAAIESFSHGLVLVAGEQLRQLEKTSESFKDGDFVCYEARLNSPGSPYKYSAVTAIWSENNSSSGIGVVYGIRNGYAFLNCDFGPAFLPGSAVHETINGLADLTLILRDGDEIKYTAVQQIDRGACEMKVLAAEIPEMIVDGVAKFAEFDTEESDGGKLAIGLITDVYQHHGFIWSKPLGSIFFSLAHVNASVNDLSRWVQVGDRVLFRAYPQEPKNNCNTRAIHVTKLKNCRFKFWSRQKPADAKTKSPVAPAPPETMRIHLHKTAAEGEVGQSPTPSSLPIPRHSANRLTRTVTTWAKPPPVEPIETNSSSQEEKSNGNSIWSEPFTSSVSGGLSLDFGYSLFSNAVEPLVGGGIGVIGDHLANGATSPTFENSPTELEPTDRNQNKFEKGLISTLTKALIFDSDLRQLFCQRYPELICCVAISQFEHLATTSDDQPKILLARLFADKEGRRILSTSRYAVLVCEVFAFYYHQGQGITSGKEAEMAKAVMKILMQDKEVRRIIATDPALTELMCQSFAQMI